MQLLFNRNAAAALLGQDDCKHTGTPFGADRVTFHGLRKIEGMFNHPCGSREADNEAQIADFDFHRFRLSAGGRNCHLIMRSAIVDQRTFERRPGVLTPARDQQIIEELVNCAREIAEPDRTAALGCS